jgi:hypothetical protein
MLTTLRLLPVVSANGSPCARDRSCVLTRRAPGDCASEGSDEELVEADALALRLSRKLAVERAGEAEEDPSTWKLVWHAKIVPHPILRI